MRNDAETTNSTEPIRPAATRRPVKRDFSMWSPPETVSPDANRDCLKCRSAGRHRPQVPTVGGRKVAESTVAAGTSPQGRPKQSTEGEPNHGRDDSRHEQRVDGSRRVTGQ